MSTPYYYKTELPISVEQDWSQCIDLPSYIESTILPDYPDFSLQNLFYAENDVLEALCGDLEDTEICEIPWLTFSLPKGVLIDLVQSV